MHTDIRKQLKIASGHLTNFQAEPSKSVQRYIYTMEISMTVQRYIYTMEISMINHTK